MVEEVGGQAACGRRLSLLGRAGLEPGVSFHPSLPPPSQPGAVRTRVLTPRPPLAAAPLAQPRRRVRHRRVAGRPPQLGQQSQGAPQRPQVLRQGWGGGGGTRALVAWRPSPARIARPSRPTCCFAPRVHQPGYARAQLTSRGRPGDGACCPAAASGGQTAQRGVTHAAVADCIHLLGVLAALVVLVLLLLLFVSTSCLVQPAAGERATKGPRRALAPVGSPAPSHPHPPSDTQPLTLHGGSGSPPRSGAGGGHTLNRAGWHRRPVIKSASPARQKLSRSLPAPPLSLSFTDLTAGEPTR